MSPPHHPRMCAFAFVERVRNLARLQEIGERAIVRHRAIVLAAPDPQQTEAIVHCLWVRRDAGEGLVEVRRPKPGAEPADVAEQVEMAEPDGDDCPPPMES